MRKVFKYSEFMNEKYEESPEFRLQAFFEELRKNINDWFTDGSLAANGAELGDIEISTLNDVDKSLIFDFGDQDNHYQVYIIISLEDVGEEELTDCYVKVKKYDSNGKLIRTMGKDVDVKSLSEDKILELFSEMESETSEEATAQKLPDIDSDLQDTSTF